ncbi:MAG: hypothetical protein WC676_08560 [Candidatus Omnitrophota bacterium]
METNEAWEKALKNTEIVRSRVQNLSTFSDTHVPYILLSESTINTGDTVVRSGEVAISRPSLILPPNMPRFNGFDFTNAPSSDPQILNFFLMRGISFPSLNYDNQTHSLNVFEGKMSEAVKSHLEQLQQKEDVLTGLIVAPDDCWQFSLLVFVLSQAIRNIDTDVKKLFDEYRKKADPSGS